MSNDRPKPLERAFVTPFFPALGVGAATGTLGAVYGGVAGTLIQTPTPLLYTSLSGIQWFCAGSTYFYCRSILRAGPLSHDRDLHRIAASGIAGCCGGAVAGAFLPRGAVVPGGIMLGVLAAASQAGLNLMGGSSIGQIPSRLRQGLAALVPMKALTDKEYEDLLLTKLLRIEAEISILDDQIADLRAASKQQASSYENPSRKTPR